MAVLMLLLQVVAFGEGHASWVSRVAFDPWLCTTSSSSGPGETLMACTPQQLWLAATYTAAAAAVASLVRRLQQTALLQHQALPGHH